MRCRILRRSLPGVAGVILLLPALSACSPAESPGTPSRTRVVLLGTGTPNAEPDRSGGSVAVVVDSIPYVIDAGAGVVRRANAARERGIEGLAPKRLKHLFLTHLHSDHTTGYADFILTPWTLERDESLKVFGPPGTEEMTDHILAAYAQDIRMRREGLEPANDRGWRVEVTEITPGVVFEDERVRVTAFSVSHGIWPYAFGYRFETPDLVAVISGDTTPTGTMVAQASGCDILVHEVYSDAGFARRDPVWQRYHARSHTSASELAEIARQTRPGLLVLYHQLLWGSTPEELLEEIASRYDGPVVYGNDLDVFPR